MKLFNFARRGEPSRCRFRLLLAATGAVMLLAGFAGTAMAKNKGVETVTYSPNTFNFEVHPKGSLSGNNNVSFFVSRKEENRGITNRCVTVSKLAAYHKRPGSQGLGVFPEDYLVGKTDLPRPLCNLTNVVVTGKPFREEDINTVCFETPRRPAPPGTLGAPAGPPVFLNGKSAVLEKDISIAFIRDSVDWFAHLGLVSVIPAKKMTLRANITCVDNTGSSGTPEIPSVGVGSGRFTPRDPRIGQGASAGNTGTTGGSAQCDLTGTWYGYNNGTRTTGWKFDQIFTAGGSITYRATHLSTQGTPTGDEGTITRSPSGNYLFNTLATSIPGARGAYQASTMRIYDADASCSKLTERQLYDSTSGMVNRPGTYWLQKAGALPGTVRSPVGRPTGPTNTFRPRRAPIKPGDRFQPGPDTPKPGPNVPQWNN